MKAQSIILSALADGRALVLAAVGQRADITPYLTTEAFAA